MHRSKLICSQLQKTRGLRAVDGLGMLLHQAVRGFSLRFGNAAPSEFRDACAGRPDLAKS
jgi:shikimate 5-dehydrogenase